MKKETKEKEINVRGITLISLVVTIIILLILAGVTISLVLGDNGIITKAKKASTLTKEEILIEEIKLEILNQQTEGINISKSNLKSMLSTYGTVKEENGKIISLMLEDETEIPISRIYNNNILEDNGTYIYTKEQLEIFRDSVNNGETYENQIVMLMSDIDLQGNEKDESTWWTPIGLRDKGNFSGTFDGNNHEVNNMYIYEKNSNYEVAFFDYIVNGTIKELTVSGTVIVEATTDDTKNCSAAGIVGYARGICLLENCKNKVNVSKLSQNRDSAGILGALIGGESTTVTIKNCINYGKIEGGNQTGGIVGTCNGGLSIENCTNEGIILNSFSKAGGIVGEILNNPSIVNINNVNNNNEVTGKLQAGGCIALTRAKVNIDKFCNNGNIISESNEAAGCVSYINSVTSNVKISNSVNNGEIKGYTTSGGIIGYSAKDVSLIINNVYNIGNITSKNREAGGIIGDTDAINYLINVYNIGKCTSTTTIDITTGSLNGSSGGIIGSSYNINAKITIINAYNIGDIDADNNASGIVGAEKYFNNSRIANVYNKGSLNGISANNGIIMISRTTENSEISNAYYLNNVETGTNLESDNTISISEDYIKSEDFVNELNKYVKANPIYKIDDETIIKLSQWKLSEEEYPIFK